MRPQLTRMRGWKVTSVEPGDHGWKITLVGNNEATGAIHTGHIPIPDSLIEKVVGKRLGLIIMDSVNTQIHFDDVAITVNALDYMMEYPGQEGIYSPQWPEEREAIGEFPPKLGEE